MEYLTDSIQSGYISDQESERSDDEVQSLSSIYSLASVNGQTYEEDLLDI